MLELFFWVLIIGCSFAWGYLVGHDDGKYTSDTDHWWEKRQCPQCGERDRGLFIDGFGHCNECGFDNQEGRGTKFYPLDGAHTLERTDWESEAETEDTGEVS